MHHLLAIFLVAVMRSVAPNHDLHSARTAFASLPRAFFAEAASVRGIFPASGPTSGGTRVTIERRLLPTDAIVTFGGTPALKLGASSNEIQLASPPHSPGIVDVMA